MDFQSLLTSAYESHRSLFAVLFDPDKPRTFTPRGADVLLVGGSSVPHPEHIGHFIRSLRADVGDSCPPVVLFPGDCSQLNPAADAMLYLSLVSGRNPEYLIGQHVRSAFAVRASGVETVPTGYILLDGGTHYSTLRVTGTEPISMRDTDTVVATALAAELLGMRLIYLEAGSGAQHTVPPSLVRAVVERVHIPVVVGGGLRRPEQVRALAAAGATMIVVGNHLELHPEDLTLLAPSN